MSELFIDPAQTFLSGYTAARQVGDDIAASSDTADQIRAQREAKSLSSLATPNVPNSALKDLSAKVNPNWNTVGEDGQPTVAGRVNENLVQANQLKVQAQAQAQQAQQARQQAERLRLSDPAKYAQAMNQVSQMEQRANSTLDKADKFSKEGQSTLKDAQQKAIIAAGTTGGQAAYDQILEGWKQSGFPIPANLPKTWSPDLKDKIVAEGLKNGFDVKPITDFWDKKQTDERNFKEKLKSDARSDAMLQMAISKLGASGNQTVSKTAGDASVEDKLADPTYGVATGKVTSTNKTAADRVGLSAAEAQQSISQLARLSQNGVGDLTASVFGDVKGTGFTTAPLKAFTTSLSEPPSRMYESIMTGLVRQMAVLENPTQAVREGAITQMKDSYQARAGESPQVRLEKLAKLKNDYIAAAVARLDTGTLNSSQAAALKKQIAAVQKAIPFDTDQVIDYTLEGGAKQTFQDYLANGPQKGAVSVSGSNKPATSSLPPGFKPL